MSCASSPADWTRHFFEKQACCQTAIAATAERMRIPVKLDIRIDGRLPRSAETTSYFVVAEALTNVTKHSAAHQVEVRMWVDGDQLHIEVADDGRGGADPSSGSGLRGLADRVAAVGGHLDVSEAIGGGTRLQAAIPCA